VHVVGHIPEMSDLLARSPRGAAGSLSDGDRNGGLGRGIALAGGLVGGVVLALLLLPDFAAWVSAESAHHFGP
jgi:hypothetical protein